MSYNRIIIEKKIKEFLEEDCSFTDVSSNIIADNAKTKAKIYAKSSGYISGLEELNILFKNLNEKLNYGKLSIKFPVFRLRSG